ncbi:MAG: hypothetical protein SVM80_12410 [Halobacteriota archaeon]|nr:hypothetical protein [Halobacteriota archaeon]
MAYVSDKLFNLGWGLVGVMFGVSILLWAMDVVKGDVATAIWIFSVGTILFGLGFVRTDKAPKGSFTLIAFGGFVLAVASAIFGVVLDLIPIFASLGIIIIVVSLVVVLTGIMRSKSKEDEKDV